MSCAVRVQQRYWSICTPTGQKESNLWSTMCIFSLMFRTQIKEMHFQSKYVQNYLMFRLIMVSSFPPLSNGCTMKNHNSEIRVQKQDPVCCNGRHVKKSWFWTWMKWVRNQWRLNHHNWIGNIFPVQDHSKVCCLIWAVVKDL